ncbi:hypothetical protein KC19_4G097000 [Ceratodon purpureus]|uniref:BOS complex subunit TMEM147 n=1 Tax=Ceratodon purpureus TaxID=3225 RepID=A0A8T0I8S5_CERPU|nr:hypothetical protein KC19_4G097000 [Ceratodon purpureus]
MHINRVFWIRSAIARTLAERRALVQDDVLPLLQLRSAHIRPPHAIYYKATPLPEYDTFNTCIKAAIVYLTTTFLKLVCLATFVQVSEHDTGFDLPQELLKGLIGFLDVAGLYYALTQVSHRSISQTHKFQAVALGWAFADAVLHRLAPLWVGAKGLEFTWEYFARSGSECASGVHSVPGRVGEPHVLRKNKPSALVPVIYASAAVVASMPSVVSYLRKGLAWDFEKVVSFELSASIVMAFVSWRLFSACQRPSQ